MAIRLPNNIQQCINEGVLTSFVFKRYSSALVLFDGDDDRFSIFALLVSRRQN